MFSTDPSVHLRSTLIGNLLTCGKPVFQIGTMLFALHYLWSDEETFQTWVNHMADSICLDGYLVVMCFEGRRVHEYFRQNGLRDFEYRNKNGETVVQIHAGFDLAEPYHESNPFGFAIDVFVHSISARVMHREYLVHGDVLALS